MGSKFYPCPSPIQQSNGKFVGNYGNKPYALFSFLEGQHDDASESYKQVAEAIARLHILTLNHKPAHVETRVVYSPTYALSCAQENATKLTSSSDANERLRWFKIETESLQLPDELPHGVCHCDTNASNFLYKDGVLSAVLDFDQSSYTWLLYDLAQLIYWWACPNTGSLDFAIAKDLVAHYNQIRQLTEQEELHLYDALKLVHLVGIGWSLADDSFENDKRKVVELEVLGRNTFYSKIFRGQ